MTKTQIKTQPKIAKDGWLLVHSNTQQPVEDGEVVLDFRGEADTIIGGRPPHKPSSGGFVWTAGNRELYPDVFGLKWVKTNNVMEGTK